MVTEMSSQNENVRDDTSLCSSKIACKMKRKEHLAGKLGRCDL